MPWISNLATATLAVLRRGSPAVERRWLLDDCEARIAEIVKREFL
jgi:hypothetical protein